MTPQEHARKMDFLHKFLFALRTHCDRLPITGKIEDAFSKMVVAAQQTMPSQDFEFLSGILPHTFGTSLLCKEMLFEAEQALILDPGSYYRYFLLDKLDALQELHDKPHAEWYRSLAKCFYEELTKSETALKVQT